MILPIILAGGGGTRLWPMSRTAYPKQFLPLVDEKNLFQSTLAHLQGLPDTDNPIIVGNEEYRFILADEIKGLEQKPTVLLEPESKNTAPAIALAALYALEKRGKDPLLLVLPTDHFIPEVDKFIKLVIAGIPLTKDYLVTFGIAPTRPAIGYGYIKPGQKITTTAGFIIDSFIEKPDLATAKKLFDTQGYYWNSGIFMFHASHFIQELQKIAPEIIEICRDTLKTAHEDLGLIRFDPVIWHQCPNISIDKSVMEKTRKAAVLPAALTWVDLGDWNTLWEVGKKDECGNVVIGDVINFDTTDCYINAKSNLIATLGIKNQIIIQTKDATLIADRERAQEVRSVYEYLLKGKRIEAQSHRKIFRPWGSFEVIDTGSKFQVKHLSVNPGGKLSLQSHQRRSEHWVVVEGSAKVTRGEEVLILSENESMYIPRTVKHRLENIGESQLNLIEVQVGDYLGEDDIVRFEDLYARK